MANDELAALQAAAEAHLEHVEEEAIAAAEEPRGEFDSDEQRDSHLNALNNEAKFLQNQRDAAQRDVDAAHDLGDAEMEARAKRSLLAKSRRLGEVAVELKRVLAIATGDTPTSKKTTTKASSAA